jgi:hypothetical protein
MHGEEAAWRRRWSLLADHLSDFFVDQAGEMIDQISGEAASVLGARFARQRFERTLDLAAYVTGERERSVAVSKRSYDVLGSARL